MAEYLWSKTNAGRRPETLKGYRVALETFCQRFGERQPYTITSSEVLSFLQHWEQNNTRVSWYRRLFTFFGWLVTKKYVFENTVARAGEKPLPDGGHGQLYTPAEARAILTIAWATDQLGFWVLSLFAGMRTCEIQRLEGHPERWLLVRLAEGVIEIPAAYAKNRRRVIPMNRPLKAWLHIIKARDLPFYPRNALEKVRRVRREVLAKSRAVPVCRTFNMGRRSYINYSLAQPGASYAEVAAAAGNSEPVIRKYYRRHLRCEDAQAYFALTPRCLGVTLGRWKQ
jgi:integrase